MINSSVLGHADREERIRQLAFQLWQIDGSPEAKAEDYWFRAAEMVDQELAGSIPVSPNNGSDDEAPEKH